MTASRKRRRPKSIQETEDEARLAEAQATEARREGRAEVPDEVGEQREISKAPRPGDDP